MFANETLIRFTALQPLNQSDREPQTYEKTDKSAKKAIKMRSFKTILTTGESGSVPFISAESIVHKLREATWLTILDRYHLTLQDFRNPLGALLTYLMINGGATDIGRTIQADNPDALAHIQKAIPFLGAYGFTLGGSFYESLTRVSFAMPFIQDIPAWRYYTEQGANPDFPEMTPKLFPLKNCVGRAYAVKADSTGSDSSISYYRHPEPMGQYMTTKGKDDKQKIALNDYDPMPHTFEYITPGTPMAFTLQFATNASALIKSAVRFGFDHWLNDRQQTAIGGHVNRGFGLVQFENFPPTDDFPTATLFEEWLTQHDHALQELLTFFTNNHIAEKQLPETPEELFTLIDKIFTLSEDSPSC